MPKKAKQVCRLFDDKMNYIGYQPDVETYIFEKPTKFRSAIRQNKFQNVWYFETKDISLVDDKREWLPDGSSYPIFVYDVDDGYCNKPETKRESIYAMET